MNQKKNIAASIKQKLLNNAKQAQRPFNELLQNYAMERLLYRLSISKYSRKFILKGALLFKVWEVNQFRTTMDIDMLGKTKNNPDNIIDIFKEIVSVECEADGLIFESKIKIEEILEQVEYQGFRVFCDAKLDNAKIRVQIDIGFNDPIFPEPQLETLPTILDLPVPKLLCYTKESAIAEKFESILRHGMLNSRMKDFYDIWTLGNEFQFDKSCLNSAIQLTLNNRNVTIPDDIAAFCDEFIYSKQSQWTAFRRKIGDSSTPESLKEVVTFIQKFLNP